MVTSTVAQDEQISSLCLFTVAQQTRRLNESKKNFITVYKIIKLKMEIGCYFNLTTGLNILGSLVRLFVSLLG